MVVGYRAIMRLQDGEDAVTVAEEQLHRWLDKKTKGRNQTRVRADWKGTGAHQLGQNSTLRVYHHADDADSSRRGFYRLTKENENGKFTVSLYAASLPRIREYRQTIVAETAWEPPEHSGKLPKRQTGSGR
ncbi:hypothetical protein CYK24_05165 [Trueperella bernardiae]|uniref:Uncharacterized protein n=1 Tax=Trueperella bernardiae TaxID=59561 RepID=A0A0W1KLU6_9ACTO|nr:hypothetical protein [Trueperella bernardiae]KTF04583.1 hypothetical protein AQZ59_00567 [Trueperella bernardiae]OCW59727.1 hypothetical protein AKG36_08885 [Trueperella bernardiae]PKZ89110.1 hypothetical protein CYK24_05165 [Trueperella bernardiae]